MLEDVNSVLNKIKVGINRGLITQRGDPGCPVIPISIGMVDFPEALCDFGSTINIMPRVADRTLNFPKEILKNLYIRVGTLYALADVVVIETGTEERAPIILGRPFLNNRAVIYVNTTKISFYIRGRRRLSFKNKTTQISEQSRHEPRKRTNRRNRNKQIWTESAKMVTASQRGQDRRLKSPFLIKKDDPGVPSIECTINRYSFQKTLYDTRSNVNIMAAVTYQLLHETMPLQPIYIQLQMIFRSLTWEKRVRSTHHPWKTVPQHYQSHYLYWNRRSPHALLL